MLSNIAGWGIGINPVAARGLLAKPQERSRRVAHVLDTLAPDWFQTWEPLSTHPKHVPCAETGAEDLAACGGHSVLFLNEPERGWIAGIKSPADAVEVTLRGMERIWRTDPPHALVVPNCNINGHNMTWLERYSAELRRRGIPAPFYWGVHLYSPRVDWANVHLERFWSWWNAYGCERPVVFSECGAGPNQDRPAHLRMMEFFRDLLDDDRVLGVAYFAAYNYSDGNQNYLGVMDTPTLAQQFVALRNRGQTT